MEERIDLLMARKVSGEATEAELQELQQWLQEHPEAGFVMEVVNATRSVPAHDAREWAVGGWAALEQMMQTPEIVQAPVTEEPLPAEKVRPMRWRWAVAAACVGVIVLAAVWWMPGRQQKTATAESNTIVTPKGARSRVQLPDGTSVQLNSSSQLTYGDGFAHGKREVTLQGEAFFTVTANEQRPFEVKAGNLLIRVLGTSFNIKAYSTDERTEVVLLSGKVAVSTTRQPQEVLLAPGQKVLVWSAMAADSLQALPPEIVSLQLDTTGNTCDETAWTQNKLIFKNRTFLSLTKDMERWYNVNIHIQDPTLEMELFNGVFEKENVTEALKALQIATPFTFHQSGADIYIKKR